MALRQGAGVFVYGAAPAIALSRPVALVKEFAKSPAFLKMCGLSGLGPF
jgi:hypothetical protein